MFQWSRIPDLHTKIQRFTCTFPATACGRYIWGLWAGEEEREAEEKEGRRERRGKKREREGERKEKRRGRRCVCVCVCVCVCGGGGGGGGGGGRKGGNRRKEENFNILFIWGCVQWGGGRRGGRKEKDVKMVTTREILRERVGEQWRERRGLGDSKTGTGWDINN